MKSRPVLSVSSGDRPAPPRFVDRGKMLLIDDVIALLSERSNGKLVRSRQWVRKHFAPEFKRKFGKDPFWYELEALAWLADLECAA